MMLCGRRDAVRRARAVMQSVCVESGEREWWTACLCPLHHRKHTHKNNSIRPSSTSCAGIIITSITIISSICCCCNCSAATQSPPWSGLFGNPAALSPAR